VAVTARDPVRVVSGLVSIVVAGDPEHVRAGLAAALAHPDAAQVVGVASDAEHALALVAREQPDVVLLGDTVGDGDLAARLRDAAPACRVVSELRSVPELAATSRRRSPDRWRELVDALPDVVIMLCDTDLRFELVTGAGLARAGIDAAALLGRTVEETLPPSSSGATLDAYREALRGNRVTLDQLRSSETGTMWRTTFVPVHDSAGEVTGAMAVSRDVTERVEAVAAARSGAATLQAAFATMLDPFVVLSPVRDADGDVVDLRVELANPAAAKASGVPADDMAGKLFRDHLPRGRPSEVFERSLHTLATGEPLVLDGVGYEDPRAPSTRRVLDVRAVRMGDGLAYTWRDVTRRTRLERALERARAAAAEAHARLEAVVDAAPLAIVALDRADRVTFWSDGAERVFGWTEDDVLGHPVPFVPESNRAEFDAVRARERAGEAIVSPTWPMQRKHGERLVALRYTAPIVRDGEVVETVAVFVDVTDRETSERQLAEALAKAQQMSEAQRAQLQSLAHDVGNPLTAIRAFARTLESRGDALDPAQRNVLLDRIVAQTDWLMRLTRDLLDAERIGASAIERLETDVGRLVRDTVDAIEHDDHEVTVEAAALVALVDPVRVRRILENLLVNAIHHTPPGTCVWVRVEPRGDDLLLAVDDDGPGIPDAQRATLFEPFERGPLSASSGLGLSLVRRFALDHDGRAWVDDREGGGASFEVLLPRCVR
jgi:PAS domain S-box-containing protein